MREGGRVEVRKRGKEGAKKMEVMKGSSRMDIARKWSKGRDGVNWSSSGGPKGDRHYIYSHRRRR